ncbi:uncharacterized protein J4E84_009273 [Alternaria hordeiaustralica]|uniref:uncharacterized protein n=1 Tax=Alternaria hordeiaustralica TaxID=1187925 RepID=UPI0020C57EF9|nr:uncharacterized protein J4E84_009273 [Alternaria hordeiaustralica]KAI4676973.1 hypothetical protein J4E84_009273 [Alternaria hordeiaustralica]
MDLDAAEKHMKDWFGDHASWSHEQLLNLVYEEDLVSVRNLQGFSDYSTGGRRPGGGRPSFPLMTQEEYGLLTAPYSQWAPAPFNRNNYSCMDRIAPLMKRQEIPELRRSPHMGFLARLRPLKAKLLLGMVPISGDRWVERKMDDPANYRNLFELINDLTKIFEWFNHEEVHTRTRDAFNWMVDRYVEFQKAANLRREQNDVEERLDLAGMWAEYWNDGMTNMSTRTHQWVVDRVDEVQARALEQYQEALKTAGTDEAAIGEAGKKYYECVQDLRGILTRLEYTIGVPMTGFKGYTATNAFTDLPVAQRKNTWSQIMGSKSFKHQLAILEAEDKAAADQAANPPSLAEQMDIMGQLTKPAHPRFRDTENLLGHYEEGKKNRDETRLALCGPPKPAAQEHWITILRERMDFYAKNPRNLERNPDAWGFVCYRLTYEQTDEEWATFQENFTKDVMRSGTWISGFDAIKSKAKIMFIDGREAGIAEGDIAAAKQHFKRTFTMLPTLGRMWTQDFLVVDKQAFKSHVDPPSEETRPPPPYGASWGSNGGHVRLVDTTLDLLSQEFIDQVTPGYKGEMKILSSLLLEELYPLLATLSVRPFGLWPCARLHPREVYVGTTDAAQEGWWEFSRIDQSLMQGFFQSMRWRQADLRARQV